VVAVNVRRVLRQLSELVGPQLVERPLAVAPHDDFDLVKIVPLVCVLDHQPHMQGRTDPVLHRRHYASPTRSAVNATEASVIASCLFSFCAAS
jgi:hypothetical protein